MGEKEVKELICQFEDYIGSLHHRLDTMEILIKSRTKSIKVGHWTEESKLSHSQKFTCSICGETAYYPQPTRIKGFVKHCPYKFCPFCGSQMS